MKQKLSGIFILLSCCLLWSCQPPKTFSAKEISLIPQVRKMTLGTSSFKFGESTALIVQNKDQQDVADQFSSLFAKSAGWKLKITTGGAEGVNQVSFKTDETLGDEGYALNVTTDRIEIKAAKPAGFFYATQTLRQLLPPELEASQKQENIEWLVPVISITDSPVFKWRGYMLDVSRHFFTKGEVLQMVD